MENDHVYDQGFDFGSFINFPEDNNMESNMDFQFPAEDISADLSFSDMQLIPDMDFSQYDASVSNFDTFEYPTSSVNESPLTANYESFASQDFRFLVDSWASTDQRSRSMKQKRRDAAIDLHLQRFMNAHSDPQLFPTESEFSFSDSPSNSSPQSSQLSPVASTPISSTSNSDRSLPQSGGQELVFDINLNKATNLPKKQKKRTQAQIDDYINARRNGACLKHKKQHKKCNCHEKQSAKGALDAKRKRKAALSKIARPVPGLVTTTPSETPSTVSRSSFSPSVFSQVDNQSFNEEIDSALASLDDLNDMEQWANVVSYGSMADASHQYYQTESYNRSPVLHRNINTMEVSTNLQTNVGYLPQQDESFNHLLGLRNGISDGGSRNTGGLVVTTGGLSGLAEGTSGPVSNVPSGRSGVPITGLMGLANAQGQASRLTQQVLSTTSSMIYPGTSPRQSGGTSTQVQNILPVRLDSPELSTMVLLNGQEHSSTPASQVLPPTSSLVPPAASLGRPVQRGLPIEISVLESNMARQQVPSSSLPPLSSTTTPARPSVVTPSPVASVLSTQQSLMALSAIAAPGLQTLFGELQPSNFTSATFRDVPQNAHLAVQQFFRMSTSVLFAAYWMSELCVMALQGMQEVAMLCQSMLYNFAGRFRQRNPVPNTCPSTLSIPLSSGFPMALRI